MNVFNSCSGLTSCTIGSGVTTIGQSAFANAALSYNNFTITAIDVPSIQDNTLTNVIGTIYVLPNLVDSYTANTRWRDCGHRTFIAIPSE